MRIINKQRLIIATTLLVAFGLLLPCITLGADAKAEPLPSPDYFSVQREDVMSKEKNLKVIVKQFFIEQSEETQEGQDSEAES